MKVDVSLFNEEPVSHSLESSKVYIGRSSQCDVIINHESMSRKHCLIEIEDGKIFVTDLGSTNGVSIDGSKIPANERTFYLNSLPLMIGAASVSIDLAEYQSQVIDLSHKTTEKKSSTPTGSFKTQKLTRESTKSTELPLSRNKSVKKEVAAPAPQRKLPSLKEMVLAIFSILIFIAMAMWHFSNQN